MKNTETAMEIERLLQFALKHKLIEKLDIIPTRNALLDLLQIIVCKRRKIQVF